MNPGQPATQRRVVDLGVVSFIDGDAGAKKNLIQFGPGQLLQDRERAQPADGNRRSRDGKLGVLPAD